MRITHVPSSLLTGLLLATIVVLPSQASATDLVKGKTLYAERCASCHGEKGAGDGPIAAGLPADQKPISLQLTEKARKYAKDDKKFKELMKTGGSGVGLSALMPAQGDLSETDIDSLLAFVKSLGSK